MRKYSLFFFLTFFALISCSRHDAKVEYKSSETHYERTVSNSASSRSETNYLQAEAEDEDENDCDYTDGEHSATVDYTNPETGFSNTYTLDVEVEDCEVTQINFPKGGWLDNDHITPEKLDKVGSCTIEGENGRTYEIQIED